MIRKMQRVYVILLVIAISCLGFCGCDNSDWAFKNNGGTIHGKRAQAGVDIGLCNTEAREPCVIAVIDCGFDGRATDVILSEKKLDSTQESAHGSEIVFIIKSLVADSILDAEDITIIDISINPAEMTPDNIIKAIKYAEEKGARIVNCSWSVNWRCDEVEERIRNSSMLFIFAAGNQHIEKCEYPAALSTNLENVISVGGLNCQGALASVSNYGLDVDIAAPAENVLIKQNQDKSYYVNGTSYAAAFVTGVAGVCLAACPDCSAAELKNALITSAEHSTLLNGYIKCAGYVSLKNTIDYLMKTGF